jgi:hypothetical protein
MVKSELCKKIIRIDFWLGDRDGFQTFSDPIDCDVQEIRRLMDSIPYEHPSNTPSNKEGEDNV